MEFTFKSIDAFETISEEVASVYNKLASQLKNREYRLTVADLEEVKAHADSELLLFVLDQEGNIAGMGQLSYHRVPMKHAGYVNAVVIDEAYRGHGLGSKLMDELEKQAKERWPQMKSIGLTSNPARGTQGFYLRLGYRMRTKEAGDETIVYVKDLA